MERWQLQVAVWIFLMCFVLVVITAADYLVTAFGWAFVTMEWLKMWWLITGLLFGAISCLVSVTYIIFREQTKKHKLTAFLLGLTLFWQEISGNLDLTWFIIDAIRRGGKPWISWDTVWTWSPFYWWAGIEWTAKEQMTATAIMNGILVVIWVLYGLYLRGARKVENENRSDPD